MPLCFLSPRQRKTSMASPVVVGRTSDAQRNTASDDPSIGTAYENQATRGNVPQEGCAQCSIHRLPSQSQRDQ